MNWPSWSSAERRGVRRVLSPASLLIRKQYWLRVKISPRAVSMAAGPGDTLDQPEDLALDVKPEILVFLSRTALTLGVPTEASTEATVSLKLSAMARVAGQAAASEDPPPPLPLPFGCGTRVFDSAAVGITTHICGVKRDLSCQRWPAAVTVRLLTSSSSQQPAVPNGTSPRVQSPHEGDSLS